jgi:hypothetical protein
VCFRKYRQGNVKHIGEFCFPVVSLASRSPSLSQENHLTFHKGSPRRHSSSPLGHLDTSSTKDILHQGKGVSRPPHKLSSPLHTKPEGQRQLSMSHLGHFATSYRGVHPVQLENMLVHPMVFVILHYKKNAD